MGNTSAAAHAGLPLRPRVPRQQRFSARFISHAFTEGSVAYDFLVEPPDSLNAPGQVVRRTFEEFQELDNVVALRHRSSAPELPPSTFFEHKDAAFLAERAAGLEAYLEALLELEPLPRLQALRQFLRISQPLSSSPSAEASACDGPLVASGYRLPIGVVASSLAYIEALWMLRACGAVCRAMRAASLTSRCWPSLSFCSSRAERWLDGLLQLLMPTCVSMEALALDLAFQNPRLAVALPAGLAFASLRRLRLRLGDAEAARLAAELLECVDSPGLQKVSLEGCMLTESLLSALCRVSLAAGGLVGLKLLWEPHRHAPIRVDQGSALAITQLLEASPRLEELEIGIAQEVRGLGVARTFSALSPPHVALPSTQPLLANTSALTALRHLRFDFLSDDVLVCLRDLTDRSLCVQRAKFSGLKRQIAEPDEAMVLLLSKLGDGLEELEFLVEFEAEMRPFARGFLHTRIGQLPGQWREREALRSLTLNWTAFDCEGVQCIVENCPRLHTLLLDRSEYWTDATVDVVVEGLPELQHFRLRGSTLLSDRALYSLGQAAHRLVSVELEKSYSMSSYALEQLTQKLCPGAAGRDFADFLDPSAGAVSLIAAAAGLPDPSSPTNPMAARQLHGSQRSSSASLRLLEPEGDGDLLCSPPVVVRHCRLHLSRW
mmetsp:Transcript_93321/g.273189  ORF Transcript_93321/g.273189 Transcript_93321/m.273189 type:complete len:663 (-) Transcript_93321:99-2087(-)